MIKEIWNNIIYTKSARPLYTYSSYFIFFLFKMISFLFLLYETLNAKAKNSQVTIIKILNNNKLKYKEFIYFINDFIYIFNFL